MSQLIQVDGVDDNVFVAMVNCNSFGEVNHGECTCQDPDLEQNPAEVAQTSAWNVEHKEAQFTCCKQENAVRKKLEEEKFLLLLVVNDTWFSFVVSD